VGDLVLTDLVRDLALNLVAATILVYGLYFRRHRRRDLMLGYMAFNISLFTVAAALASTPLNVGVGFGLFAVLSIVRLRSDEAAWSEIGYTMVALVLGLLLGLPGLMFEAKVLFAVVLLATMYVADNPVLVSPDKYQRYRVTLDVVHTDPDALRLELERRLGGTVRAVIIQDIDYVRETMRVDVRLRMDLKKAPRSPEEATV
jgi:hypothetical protein